MKLFYAALFGLIALFFFSSCSSCSEQTEEIERLKNELNKKIAVYNDLDLSMKSIDQSLSKIKTEQNDIDSLLNASNAVSNKDLILEKIEKIQDYVKDSRKKIKDLETQLTNADSKETEGLKKIIAQLRQELIAKDVAINTLKDKVQNLESNITFLRNEINTKNTIIEDLEEDVNISNAKADSIKKKQQQDIIEAREKKLQENIKKFNQFWEQGKNDEAAGDNTTGLLKNKEQDSYYIKAYNNYKSALDIYSQNPEITGKVNNTKSEITNKINKVRDKMSKASQKIYPPVY